MVPLLTEVGEVKEAAEVASRHHAGLFRWALVLSRWNREEAMEIVQQTYLEVLEGRADLLSAGDPRSYLFGVARRVAASRRRRRSTWGRILRLELSRRKTEDESTNPENEAASGESLSRLKRALGQLRGRQLQILCLVFREGMTIEGAAHALGISVGSARTHHQRAKNKLARLMEDHDGLRR